jgi:hypothetical protein
MFEAGNTIIADMASAAESLSKAAPTPVRALEAAIGGKSTPQVMASSRTKPSARSAKGRTTLARLTVGRVPGKSARHGKQVVGIGVGGPIIAAEEGQRKSSTKHVKHGTRIVIGPTKITVVAKEDRKSSGRQAKHDTRVSARGARVTAVEESRRKPKSGRG